ncbi:MAG: transposase [Bdellovibrio sp.]
MPRKRHTPEEIIQHLRTADIDQSKGLSIEESARKIGVTPPTLARWKAEFGGLRVDQAKRLKEIEQENTRLKKIVADQAIDISILKEVAKGNF